MTNAMIDAILDLFFKNSAFSNVGDSSGLQPSGSAGNFWISLHTSDPGVSGSQSTNETSYGAYARVSVARSGAGWVRTGQSISPAATITFPQCTSGTATITHAGLGSDSTGAGHLFWSGAVSPNISVATGVIPELTTASTLSLT